MSHDHRPLADRLRPNNLDEFVGQDHLLGQGKVLRQAIEQDKIMSMILWGPPGCGKTTLAEIIAHATGAFWVKLSAVTAGVKDIKAVVAQAQTLLAQTQQRTILFVDEVHRFNKAQQDAFLPYVENGTIILIGATTENPSFEVNSALLSRCRVFVLQALSPDNLELVLQRALVVGVSGREITSSPEVLRYLANMSNGDARVALNALEIATQLGNRRLSLDQVKEALQRSHLLYDQTGEEHYNLISALHKSLRGGDANAALYWLGRMLESGEDPLYIARRLIRFASEDVGVANSWALVQAVAAYQACHFIGMPECSVNLAQAVVYLAKSKKSNALYSAYQKVQKDLRDHPAESVPLHLRNAPTQLMRDLGYGQGYKYTPDYLNPAEAQQDYLPLSLRDRRYLPEEF